jgi:branched-chain amino acid transport system ATP-binding protein
MLNVEHLQKSFDGFMAVADANLDIDKGEVVAVIGPNGAGKTTLFHLITGQVSPDKGRILFKGEDIAGMPPYDICRKGICRSYQVVNIFKRMTVFENVQVALMSFLKMTFNVWTPARKILKKETLDILESVGLAEKADQICAALSHGDQKVLEIAIALGNRPELLILDEPTAGMSAEETAMTLALMNRLSGELGLTILFCEHDMELVFSISHRIMVMQHGTTLIQSTPDQVKTSQRVQEAYLGESTE